jgi:tight adherence protein B
MKRVFLGGLVALAAALAASTPASAATATLSEARSAEFPDRAWVLTLPERVGLTEADVSLRENGRRVENIDVVPGDAAGPRSFGVVLAIDTSESMHGKAIEGAISAARTYAKQRPTNQQLGLLFFSRTPSVALPMTTKGDKIDAALADTPGLLKGTRIYDAGLAAIKMLREADVRAGTVVMMSDGADVGSEATSTDLSVVAKRAHVRVFTVGLQSSSFNPSTLEDVAGSTGGQYSEAGSSSDLRKIYASLGRQLSSEYLLTYQSLAKLGRHVTVEAHFDGSLTPVLAEYDAPRLSLPAVSKSVQEGGWSKTLPVVIAIVGVALLLALALWLAVRGPRRGVRQRIEQYVTPTGPLTDRERQGHAIAAVAASFERRLGHVRWWPRYAQEIELAGVPAPPGQFAGLVIGGTALLVWLFLAIDRPLAAVLMAFVPLLVHLVLRSRVLRRRRAFGDQLAANLQVVASAMRAGHSFAGGLSVAAEDAEEPARTEFARIVNDERLGVPIEDAMVAVAKRMESLEMEHLAIVVQLQRDSGGNTAEVLDHVVDTIRYRGELNGLVRSLTAQGKLGGSIVTALPLVMMLLLSVLSPGYLQPMFDHFGGVVALIVAGTKVTVGWLVIRKIVDIKV